MLRAQAPGSYYELDARFGLQSIPGRVHPIRGNPAVVHMLVSAFRKCEDMPLLSSRERREACLRNVRTLDDSLVDRKATWGDSQVYVKARDWIRQVLGSVPSNEAVHYSARHGPGSSASIPYRHRSKLFKLLQIPYRTTPAARCQLANCIAADPRWGGAIEDYLRRRDNVPMWALLEPLSLVNAAIDHGYPYNKVTTVPKDGRKDRPIAIEQTGNIYLQLGVGSIIRTRLRAAGLDLDKQADVNRKLALESSRTSEHFTIDLSNASDTISVALVEWLLPPDWFRLLDSLRAPWGVLPSGEAFLYRKFSSMGNGYTFELETLIFLAICEGIRRTYGCRSDRFVAFGDDIIGPDYLYLHTQHYLEYAGFRVNSEKSFHGRTGVRESCGVDALDGLNIRPFFVKRIPQFVTEAVGLRNRIRAWFLRNLGDYPARLDSFLIGESLDVMPPIGPDSIETDGWLQDGPWFPGARHGSMVVRTKNVGSPKELHLRKLMHDLRSCDGEGGNFLVTDEASDRYRLVDRVVDSQFDWVDY